MKVSLELAKEYTPPYAVIYADALTEEIRNVMDVIGTEKPSLIARQGEKLVILKPEEICMIRIEGGDTVIRTAKEKYCSRKRLYEILDQLGGDFMQISKQTAVRLSCIRSVEAGFSGTLFVKLKNGDSDYVSRKYLPEFKKYFGL